MASPVIPTSAAQALLPDGDQGLGDTGHKQKRPVSREYRDGRFEHGA
jgi:hypothetical protein